MKSTEIHVRIARTLLLLSFRSNCYSDFSSIGGRVKRRNNYRAVSFTCLLFCCHAVFGLTSGLGYVQGNYSTPQSAKSAVAVKYRAAQTAGDLNVVVVGWNDSSATVQSISDTSGNTYSLALGPTVVNGSLTQSIYFAKNIAPATAGVNTVTVRFSTAASYPDIRILEYNGADTTNPVDTVGANSGTNSPSSASTITANSNDLIFAANIVRSATNGPGSGFTKRLLTSPDADIAEDEMVTVAGGYTATAPISDPQPWIMQVIAFRAPSAAGSSNSEGTVVTPSTLSCNSNSMAGAGTDVCTVTLNSAAPSGAQVVALSSSSSSVAVPSSITVAAGATMASFSATVSSVSASQNVTLTASANGVAKTFILQLNAAAAPLLSVNATGIAFGTVNLNTPTTQLLTLTSAGGVPVTVSSVAIAGTGFTFSGATFPLTLTTPQSATLTVLFDPTTAGTANGQLTIKSNSSANPTAIIGLSGTGQAASYSVSVTWQAPTNSADPVAGYNIYRSPSGGSSYQLLSSMGNAQLSYTDNGVQAGQAYDYIVESVDATGVESGPSNTASVTVP